jgi:hypothetical protein
MIFGPVCLVLVNGSVKARRGTVPARAEMNLTQRPEVAGLRTSVVCEHIRNPYPAGPGWRAALGLLPAPLKSSTLRDWETRVTGKGDVPCGARAAEVGGAPLCLVELRMPAGAAEPWLRAQLQPRSIRRPFRHVTQNMPPCWALAQPGLWPAPSHNSGPHQRRSFAQLPGQARGWPAPGAGRVRLGRGDGREGFPAAGCGGGRGIVAARCRGATRHLGPLLSGRTVRPRRTR